MITNSEYLIQRLAEANEWHNTASIGTDKEFWRGSSNAYQRILNESFPEWDAPGTTGYYVLNEGMTYDEALNAAGKAREEFDRDQSNYHAERDPEEKYWKDVTTWNERHSHGDVDDYDY
jgi:hypothetical protein